jgi:hypothetical protein
MSKHADQFVVGVERRVREVLQGEGFDGVVRLRELYDEMVPLLGTWESNAADGIRLDEIEREAQAVGVAMHVKGKTWDRRTVKNLLDEFNGIGVSHWLESEVLSAEVHEGVAP